MTLLLCCTMLFGAMPVAASNAVSRASSTCRLSASVRWQRNSAVSPLKKIATFFASAPITVSPGQTGATMKSISSIGGIVFATVVAAIPSTSTAAPQQLLGKHIRLTASVTLEVQPVEGGTPVTVTQSSERIIYISSAGRIFARGNYSNGSGAAVREQSPNKLTGDDIDYRWQGNVIVGTSRAVQSTISFDPSFQTCTGTSVLKPNPTSWSTDHKLARILHRTINSSSCSIHDGNPFANE